MRFTFDGVPYEGRDGDTLASALLRNGVRVVARSVELGRPRGIFSHGSAEPNAFVQIGTEPMVAATMVDLYDGLDATSLNGKGRVVLDGGPAFDKAHLHCDVVVIGGGPAGLAAARTAGGRVILLDEGPELGGDLLTSGLASEWLQETIDGLAAEVHTRTTAIGYYDHNYVVARSPSRLLHIRARRVVLATGALERPIAFSGNDRPGVMLAGSVRHYVRRHGVVPGRRAVVFTCTDSGYAAALSVLEAGADVAAIVDPRVGPCGPWADRLWQRGVPVLRGHQVIDTEAAPDGTLAGVLVAAGGDLREISCDLLAVSGGWNPATQLYTQAQGRLRFDDRIHAFVPDDDAPSSDARCRCAGACRGLFGTADAIADGALAARADDGFATSADAGLKGSTANGGFTAPAVDEPAEQPAARLWRVPPWDHSPQFVDLHRDVTVAALEEAIAAGLRSPEHIKRYTTAGTGPDQGRTAVTAGVLAELLGASPVAPSARPPFSPVPFAALAGRDRGRFYDPVRLTPMHSWHEEHGAVFEDVGQWKRPWYFPRDGESMADAVARECRAARTDVAAIDASTLGKIDIRGPDAALFLDRVYVGRMGNLPVGRCRYGIMCGPDGMILDDGVTARLPDEPGEWDPRGEPGGWDPRRGGRVEHFHMTTTTGNAQAVLDHLEEWLQTEWPELRVSCVPVTDHWATVAVAGPRSPELVAALGIDPDMRFMDWRDFPGGRVFRISFSGEVAYEINVPAWYGLSLWERVMELGATPYGTEAMHVLRAEVGFFMVGNETDGTVTPEDVGFTRYAGDFIGREALRRPDCVRKDRKRLAGLLTPEVLPEGTQLVATNSPNGHAAPDLVVPSNHSIGHITSSYYSPAMGRAFAMAMISGEHATAYAPDHDAICEVTSPAFITPEVPAAAPPEPAAGGPSWMRRRAPMPETASGRVRLREAGLLPMAELRGTPMPMPSRTTRTERSHSFGFLEIVQDWEGLPLGPDWWLLVGSEGAAVETGVDVSAQRVILELSGPGALDLLITGCTLDLHAFEVGACAQTLLAKVPVVLHRRSEDVYRIFVRPSFSAWLADWLTESHRG